jgi:transposase-like protein
LSNRPSVRQLNASYRRLGTVTAVAAELGVAFETARRWLIDAEVQLKPKGRPSSPATALSARKLGREYSAGSSIAAIGEVHGVSPATIRARLIEAGVALRPRRGWKY